MDAHDIRPDEHPTSERDSDGISWGWFALCVLVLYLMWTA